MGLTSHTALVDSVAPVGAVLDSRPTRLFDKHGRTITDLRISITDRCNYRCVYCRTGKMGAQFPELSFAEYLRVARVFASLGIAKVRITGGEPLLRAGLVDFVRDLARIRNIDGDPLELAITTNGHLLADLAQPLKDAGLTRITVSMDAVDEKKFAAITRVPGSYSAVLAGVRAARQAGLDPVKINCVLLRGFNEDQVASFGKFAREEGVVVRFIEFMPLEEERVWSPEVVVTMQEVLARMNQYHPLIEIERGHSETARRFVFDDGEGEIGIIAPVSNAFCNHCSRVRLTSDGKIRTCLFSTREHDLLARIRGGAGDEELADYIAGVVMTKEEGHRIGEPDFQPASRSMVHIGG